MTNAKDLSPCPFCGGLASFGKITDPDHADWGGEWISCDNPLCECSTGLRWNCGDDAKPLLAETWNRRAPAVTREEVARVLDEAVNQPGRVGAFLSNDEAANAVMALLNGESGA